jgi:hypothetical protein
MVNDSGSYLLQTRFGDLTIEFIQRKIMNRKSLKERMDYLSERVREKDFVLVIEDIDSIFFDVNEISQDFEKPEHKLRILVNSIADCCGCFFGSLEFSKIDIPIESGIILSSAIYLNQITNSYDIASESLSVIKADKLDISYIENVMQSAISSLRNTNLHVVQEQGKQLVDLYKPKDKESSAILNDLIHTNGILKSYFQVLYRLIFSLESINQGELVFKGSKSAKKLKVRKLLSTKEDLVSAIDKIIVEEKKLHRIFGEKTGKYFGANHEINILHGGLHRGSILYDRTDPMGGLLIIDWDLVCPLLRRPKNIECACDIVTLFIDLSPLEWKSFEKAYIDVRGRDGKEITKLINKEWARAKLLLSDENNNAGKNVNLNFWGKL